jgi:hypothetical protein
MSRMPRVDCARHLEPGPCGCMVEVSLTDANLRLRYRPSGGLLSIRNHDVAMPSSSQGLRVGIREREHDNAKAGRCCDVVPV